MNFQWTAKYKKLLAVFLLSGVLLWLFMGHNQRLYQTPIAQVEQAKTIQVNQTKDQFENRDQEVTQRLRLKLLNTKHRGKKLTVQNQYYRSMGLTQRYRTGNQVFLSQLNLKPGHHVKATVSGLKRDRTLIMLLWLVTGLLVFTLGKAGGLAMLSVVINSILLITAIEVNLKFQSWNAFAIFAGLALVFAMLSLVLVLGLNKKMIATLASTILGTSVAVLLSYLILQITNERGVYYESMQYVTQVPRPLFLAETLIGSLGAVMDESSDIVATLFELKTLDPAVSFSQLFSSGRKVGRSIMGPLVNVLFLIFMADTFTSALMYLKNGNSIFYTFNMNMSLGMVQSLVSGIGIVLAVPLVSFFAASLLGRRQK
ncbi:YibE/F family protein [Lactobacillus alvi]|uniref:YibE/F family protein n=1 Tax=Limosilactobacillus alvi TaxID=990412 RepID=A0ABS2EQ00_9LACO|nr:YibE/F family protein [Limosilactobacillus alvi]MBM6754465.1 YibE/F family protein [Limosilactobacillus alvi]